MLPGNPGPGRTDRCGPASGCPRHRSCARAAAYVLRMAELHVDAGLPRASHGACQQMPVASMPAMPTSREHSHSTRFARTAGQSTEFARLAAGTPATRFAGPDAGGPGMDNVKVIAVMVPPLKVQGLTIRRLEGGWKRYMHRNAMQPACLSFTAQKNRRLCGVRTTCPGQLNCGDEASTSPPLKNATMFQPPGSCCQTRPTENRNSYCMAGGVIGMTNNDR